eukprot:UN14490
MHQKQFAFSSINHYTLNRPPVHQQILENANSKYLSASNRLFPNISCIFLDLFFLCPVLCLRSIVRVIGFLALRSISLFRAFSFK